MHLQNHTYCLYYCSVLHLLRTARNPNSYGDESPNATILIRLATEISQFRTPITLMRFEPESQGTDGVYVYRQLELNIARFQG